MATIKIWWADDNLLRQAKKLMRLSERFPVLVSREINKVGNRAKTQVIRNLTKQTGLPRDIIVRAVGNPTVAKPGRLSYDMVTRGGNIRLKYFSPKETDEGVAAKPFGKRVLYPGAFMRGGRWPNRVVVPGFKGHVFYRIGYGKRKDGSFGEKITFARSGVVVPHEMTKDATAGAFKRIAGPLLKSRIENLLIKHTR